MWWSLVVVSSMKTCTFKIPLDLVFVHPWPVFVVVAFIILFGCVNNSSFPNVDFEFFVRNILLAVLFYALMLSSSSIHWFISLFIEIKFMWSTLEFRQFFFTIVRFSPRVSHVDVHCLSKWNRFFSPWQQLSTSIFAAHCRQFLLAIDFGCLLSIFATSRFLLLIVWLYFFI